MAEKNQIPSETSFTSRAGDTVSSDPDNFGEILERNEDWKDEEPTESYEECDNHPGTPGTLYTPGDAVRIVLCDECTPSWFKDD